LFRAPRNETIDPSQEERLPAVVEKVRGCWTEAYMLRHCTGFRVEGPAGHLDYVEEVLLDPEEGAPKALLVRGTSTIVVPLSQIRRLVPGQERVLLGPKVRT
jgi:hypothetical protein